MKVVRYHRTALSRQVGEAIRIHRRGLVLNSKSEYNRCKITRLSLEQGEDLDNFEQEQHSDMAGDGDFAMDKDWTASLLEKRDEKDQDKRRGLGKVEKTSGRKRRENGAADTKRSKKKRKYGTIGNSEVGALFQ